MLPILALSFMPAALLALAVGLVFFFLLALLGRTIMWVVTGYVEPGPGDWVYGLGIGILAVVVGLCYGVGTLILDLLGWL